MVGYAHSKGFGRMFFAMDGGVTQNTIERWEKIIAGEDDAKGKVCIINVVPLAGDITPRKEE